MNKLILKYLILFTFFVGLLRPNYNFTPSYIPNTSSVALQELGSTGKTADSHQMIDFKIQQLLLISRLEQVPQNRTVEHLKRLRNFGS